MIELLIFHLHIVAGLYAFTTYWQKYGLRDGFLALGLVVLCFVIGWSIMGTVAAAIYPHSWNNVYFSSDTLGLVMLIIPEVIFFYYFFIKNEKLTSNDNN